LIEKFLCALQILHSQNRALRVALRDRVCRLGLKQIN